MKGVARHGISIRLACQVYGISQTCYRYQAKLDGENAQVADWLLRLTQAHKRWGFGLCFLYLRNVKDYRWNHKSTQNAYIERFNRTVRHEWLDLHEFTSIAHAQLLATQWLWQYNNERPNTAIGGIPPRLLQAA